MRSAVCGNHTKRAVRVSACCPLPVKKHYLSWSFNNFVGGPHTGHARILTSKGRGVVMIDIEPERLNLGLILRFVRRLVRPHGRNWISGFGAAVVKRCKQDLSIFPILT